MSRFHCCRLGAGVLGNGASLPFPCTLIKAWSLPKGGVIPPPALGKGFDNTFLGVTPSDATASHGEIGRASCRERGKRLVVGGSLNEKCRVPVRGTGRRRG